VNEQIANVYVCSEDSWTVIPIPVGNSTHAKLCVRQEKLLRSTTKGLTGYPAALRAKGDGSLTVDLEGIHWTWKDKNLATLKLQIAIMDGQTVLAHREFEKEGRPSERIADKERLTLRRPSG
jgi:hypothetical protein